MLPSRNWNGLTPSAQRREVLDVLRGHFSEQWNVRRMMVIIAVEFKDPSHSIPAT